MYMNFIDNEYDFWNEHCRVSQTYYAQIPYNKTSTLPSKVYNKLKYNVRRSYKTMYESLYHRSAHFIRFNMFFEDINSDLMMQEFNIYKRNYNRHIKEINYCDKFTADCKLLKNICLDKGVSIKTLLNNKTDIRVPYIVVLYATDMISFETVLTLFHLFPKMYTGLIIYDVNYMELVTKLLNAKRLISGDIIDIEKRRKIFVDICLSK